MGTGTGIVWFVESPELLGIVPTEEVRVVLEEVFEGVEVVVLNVGVSSTGWLQGEPHIISAADGCPRLIGEHSVLWHLVDFEVLVVLTRQREVETHEWFYIVRDEVDDTLWVGVVPHVDVNQP